jgi:hypothetical protein
METLLELKACVATGGMYCVEVEIGVAAELVNWAQ